MAFDISNLYEQMVIDEILQRYGGEEGMDHDDMEDMACVAINTLPAKYFRHGVDLVYYMSPEERVAMEVRVTEAVETAYEFVEKHKTR
jgi:hypothetical protein